MKVKVNGDGRFWWIWCPGCKASHCFEAGRWTFDGNMESPTFSPSLITIVNSHDREGHDPEYPTERCHLFVRAGRIQFLSDCTHSLAGETVDLPHFPTK